jgi:hypothetical protein
MSQHDLILDNGSGAAFRADTNSALAALGSSMKGPNAPPVPLAGMIWVDDDTPSATIWTVKQYDGADWIELGRLDIAANIYIPSAINFLAGMRNLIINGNPVINQRVYVSGTATSGANQYTLDRWRVVVSGQALSWTDSAGIRTVTFPAGGGEQVIEAVNNLGGVHTLSWTGTATATVNGASVANGGQVTLTGNTDVTIRMSGGTGAQMQLERGAIATPFGFRQHGQELALCYRYLSIQDAYARGTASGAGAVIETPIYWPVTMRVAPTLTGPVGALNLNVSSAITAAPTVRSCRYSITAAAAGDFYSLGGLVAASSEF